MAQDLKKIFEKEKIEEGQKTSPEDEISLSEKKDKIKEIIFEDELKAVEREEDKKEKQKKLNEPSDAISGSSVLVSASDYERQKHIDKILAEGLNDVFLTMKPSEQQKFKEEGEKTVKKINELLTHAKVKLNKIINLIRRWLKLIPKVNRHFLEQEAKIKADRIMKLKK